MSQTITITTKTIADHVGEYLSKLTNFDASKFLCSSLVLEPVSVELYDWMATSESILARQWDTPEEDEAWANL